MDLDLSFIGWIHGAACLFALVLGPIALFRRKGSAAHARFGKMYLLAMVAVNATAFLIYRRHMFWFPHWFAVTALACVGIAYGAVHWKRPRRGWIHVHLTAMLASYYVLVGGGVNEVYLRVAPLRRVAEASQGAAIGLTHFAVQIFFLIVIVAANVVARSRSRAPGRRGALPGPRASALTR